MQSAFQSGTNPAPAGRRVRNLPPADTFIVQCFVDLSAPEPEGPSSLAKEWKGALYQSTEVGEGQASQRSQQLVESAETKKVALVRLPNDASVLELLIKVFPEAHDWSQQELEEAYVVTVACGDGTANSAFPLVFPLRTSASGAGGDLQTQLGTTPEKKRRSSSIAASELGTSFASAGSGGYASSSHSPARRGTNPHLPPALNRYPPLRQAMGLRFPYMVHVTTAAAFAQSHNESTTVTGQVGGAFVDIAVSGSGAIPVVGGAASEFNRKPLAQADATRLGVATDGSHPHRPASPNPVDPTGGKSASSAGASLVSGSTLGSAASDEKLSKQGETMEAGKAPVSRAQLREMARRQKWIEKEQNEKRIAKREAALKEIEEAKKRDEEERRQHAKEREVARMKEKHEAELKRLTQDRVRQEKIEAIEKEKMTLRNRSLTAHQEAKARFEDLHNSTLQKVRDESRLSAESLLVQPRASTSLGAERSASTASSFLPSLVNGTSQGAANRTALPAPEEEVSTGVRFNRERLLHNSSSMSNRNAPKKGSWTDLNSTVDTEGNLSKLIHALDVSTANEATYTEKLHQIEQRKSENRDAEKLYLLHMEKAVTKKLQMKSQFRRTVAEQQISLVRAVEVDRKSAEAEETHKNAEESKRLEEYYAAKRAIERKAAEIAAERTAYEEAVQRQVDALRQQKFEPPARIDNWVL